MVFGAIVSDDINCAQFMFYALTKVLVFITTFVTCKIVTAFSMFVIILYYSSRENPNIKTLE
jgi:hypothetical protein